ncbi:MAG: DUF1015 domain-containing protein [Actinomycetia bacterium]|nr:DUF1015 domain-containing protein [Actinomycetes bacterium]
MVDISPFRGLIYNKEAVKDISKMLSPPYDVISEDARKKILDCAHENIINLILPSGNDDEKYSNARNLLEKWINKKILIYDDRECYYILEIDFDLNGEKKKMLGLIGLTRIEPYSSGKVLRHEKTLSGPKKDRYRLLEACRTNFGLIYTIYRDDDSKIDSVILPYLHKKPFMDVCPCYDSSLSFKVWRISDIKDISMITGLMKTKSILIADGHHRYETSLMYRNELKKNFKKPGQEDFALTLFMESGQEDIKIYPTYRSINFKDFDDISKYFNIAKSKYTVKPLNINNASDIKAVLDGFRKENIAGFIFYHKNGAHSLILNSKDFASKPEMDIYILHNDILKELDRLYTIKNISFNHNEDSIIDDVKEEVSDLAIFLNPPTINEMEDICNSGGLMPQKSTFFWPKPCTGLVMYKF